MKRDGDRYLTTSEVGALCRVTRTAVAEWVRQGKLPAVRVGRRWLIVRSGLEAMLAKHEGESNAG